MTSALTINRTLEFMNRWLHGLSFPIQVCGSRSISDARFWTFLRAIHILGMGPKSTHELHLWFLYPYTTTLNALLYAILNNFVHKTKFHIFKLWSSTCNSVCKINTTIMATTIINDKLKNCSYILSEGKLIDVPSKH